MNRNIKQSTIDKVVKFATELKTDVKDNLFSIHNTVKAHKLHASIPAIMVKLTYITRVSKGVYICNYETFEPIMARNVVNKLYEYTENLKLGVTPLITPTNKLCDLPVITNNIKIFTDTELTAELKSRGYIGSLLKEIKL